MLVITLGPITKKKNMQRGNKKKDHKESEKRKRWIKEG